MRTRYPILTITFCLWVSGHNALAGTLEDATAAYAADDLQAARTLLDTVLTEAAPGSSTYRIADQNLAVLKAQQGDLDGALSKLEAVISAQPVAAAAFENIKALRALQAAQSLNRVLGDADNAPLPDLLWLDSEALPEQAPTPEANTETLLELSGDNAAAIDIFLNDYASALGARDAVRFLSLYAPAYAPADGNSRASWQLELLGAFADSAAYTPSATLDKATPLNDTLTVVAFSLHDPRKDSHRPINVLLQRDTTKQWKILSDL